MSHCTGRLDWPKRGVYFFFEPGEVRSDTGTGVRVVRVGTHALTAASRTTLWNRLSQHRGSAHGGGNHRGAIFCLLVGSAIKGRDGLAEPVSWGSKPDLAQAAKVLGVSVDSVRQQEEPLEHAVSGHIGRMPFLWVAVDDPAGDESHRGLIERNSVGLLSNFGKPSLDLPSPTWLGKHCDRERVRRSGLWNNNHVDEPYDPRFLDVFARHIDLMAAALPVT